MLARSTLQARLSDTTRVLGMSLTLLTSLAPCLHRIGRICRKLPYLMFAKAVVWRDVLYVHGMRGTLQVGSYGRSMRIRQTTLNYSVCRRYNRSIYNVF